MDASRFRSLGLSLAMTITLATMAEAAPRARPPLAYWAFNCFTTCGESNFAPEARPLGAAA